MIAKRADKPMKMTAATIGDNIAPTIVPSALTKARKIDMEPSTKERNKHPHRVSCNSNILRVKSAKPNPMNSKQHLTSYSTLFNMLNEMTIDPEPMPEWKAALPTRSELHKNNFGRPTKNHSCVQEASFETCMSAIVSL